MNLQEFFSEHKKIALAFSGGVDSGYLLYEALRNGCDVKAYFVKTDFQPDFELQDAMRTAKELGAKFSIVGFDVLENEFVTANPVDRCFFCKAEIFTHIIREANRDGYTEIMDGTNFSDDVEERAGFKIITTLGVLSPLRICGITKDEIRKRAKEANLFIHDKPSYACLATRIPTKTIITKQLLTSIETCENFLFQLGFSDFRVRIFHQCAKIQLREEDFALFVKNRAKIRTYFLDYFPEVLVDTKTR